MVDRYYPDNPPLPQNQWQTDLVAYLDRQFQRLSGAVINITDVFDPDTGAGGIKSHAYLNYDVSTRAYFLMSNVADTTWTALFDDTNNDITEITTNGGMTSTLSTSEALITVPNNGNYMVAYSFSTRTDGGAVVAGNQFYGGAMVNGSVSSTDTARFRHADGVGNNYLAFSSSGILAGLTAGDEVEVGIYHTQGANVSFRVTAFNYTLAQFG